MGKTEDFIMIFSRAERYYAKCGRRLAGEGWDRNWKTLFATILSAQTRDDTTIAAANRLFNSFPDLKSLSEAEFSHVKELIHNVNYNNTKAKNVINAAKYLLLHHGGNLPRNIEELTNIPGVGRKTANLVLSECYGIDGICVDTHVHRISNVFGFVRTKTPEQTERELMRIIPKKYWSHINRTFVLWGQDVRGNDKKKFLEKIEE